MCVVLYVMLCAGVYVGTYICTYMKRPEEAFCSNTLYLIPLRILSLNPELRLVASKPQQSSYFHPYNVRVVVSHTAMPCFLCKSWRFELRSSCVHSKHSYPLIHLSGLHSTALWKGEASTPPEMNKSFVISLPWPLPQMSVILKLVNSRLFFPYIIFTEFKFNNVSMFWCIFTNVMYNVLQTETQINNILQTEKCF